MKAAAGETESGGDMRLWAMVDGRSLEILCVLDLTPRGETMPEAGRDMARSGLGAAMMAVYMVSTGRPIQASQGILSTGLRSLTAGLSFVLCEASREKPGQTQAQMAKC